MPKPSTTNSPRLSFYGIDSTLCFYFLFVVCVIRYYGGYGYGVPPLPIPNREVKPVCADGTAIVGE